MKFCPTVLARALLLGVPKHRKRLGGLAFEDEIYWF
tara:strand:- start:471 stop:578 length:108 start_codon:yes stop_codon:yes gene_type:complete